MGRTFEKIAIANRGEVAVRVIRACQELGLKTVLLHSDVDQSSEAYRLADERICIGPAPSKESYLNIQNNIDGAKSCGADAIHPGFGFLSENAEFAEGCEKNRIVFIGPSPESILLFGDKISAKKLADKLGVPTIPGYQGDDQSDDKLVIEAEKIGFPVLAKAANGGGGRGQKVILSSKEAKEQIQSARRESLAAFGDDKLFLEKYLDSAKHIEIQIFGDASGRVFCLGERECSVQRRHQKIIEESPAAGLQENVLKRLREAAVSIAKAAKYQNAGTVEFLVQNGEFYFLEMNTRLQVEHPVTEMVYNVDLVKAQIHTAQGLPVLWEQDLLSPRGHAFEARICAEDPQQNGLPSIGKILGAHWPTGPGRRFEIGFTEGDEITANYDSMFAKVIVWDESRPRALAKLKQTLSECVVFGVRTNIPYVQAILEHPEFIDGSMNTQFISQYFTNGLPASSLNEREKDIINSLKARIGGNSGVTASAAQNPWTGFSN